MYPAMNNIKSIQEIIKFYKSGGTLAALTSMTQQDLNVLHGYAYNTFQAGDFTTARNIFMLLSYLEHWNYDYTLSLGICHQRLADHEDAQLCFARCATLIMQDPRAPYYAGISYALTKKNVMAKKAFKACLLWCNGKEEYKSIEDSAKKLLKDCKEKT